MSTPGGLAWGTDFETREEDISWLLPLKIRRQTTLKYYAHFRPQHGSCTWISFWPKRVMRSSSRWRVGKYIPPATRSKQVTRLRPTSAVGDICSCHKEWGSKQMLLEQHYNLSQVVKPHSKNMYLWNLHESGSKQWHRPVVSNQCAARLSETCNTWLSSQGHLPLFPSIVK